MYKIIGNLRIVGAESPLYEKLDNNSFILIDSFNEIDTIIKQTYLNIMEEIPQKDYCKLDLEFDVLDILTGKKITLHPKAIINTDGYNPFKGIKLKEYIKYILEVKGTDEEILSLHEAINDYEYDNFLSKIRNYTDIPSEKLTVFDDIYHNKTNIKKFVEKLQERDIDTDSALTSLIYFIERKSPSSLEEKLNINLFEKCFNEALKRTDAFIEGVPNKNILNLNKIFTSSLLSNLFKEKLDLVIKQTKNTDLKKYKLFMLSYFEKSIEYEFNSALPIFEGNLKSLNQDKSFSLFSNGFKVLSTNWNKLLLTTDLNNFNELLYEKLDGELDFYKTIKNIIENDTINKESFNNLFLTNLKELKQYFINSNKAAIKIGSVFHSLGMPLSLTENNNFLLNQLKKRDSIKNFINTIIENYSNEDNKNLLYELQDYLLEALDSPTTKFIVSNYITEIGNGGYENFKRYVLDKENGIGDMIDEVQNYIKNDKEKELLKLNIMLNVVELLETAQFTYENKKDFLHRLLVSEIDDLKIIKDLEPLGEVMNFIIKNSNVPLDTDALIVSAFDYVKNIEKEKKKNEIETYELNVDSLG